MEPDASAEVNVVEMNMSLGSMNESAAREQLSALVDGELDGADVGDACGAWYAHASQRSAWHTYHLIGDVMRSDDLAFGCARDAAFLVALRARLAAEPVVLAPLPVASLAPAAPQVANGARSRRGHWTWMVPTAAAAGFVAVASVLIVNRAAAPASPTSTLPTLAQAPTPAPSEIPEAAAEPQVLVANGQLIRDAQLDRYLAAHKQFAGSSALGVPSAFLRSATVEAPAR
jgi:sigma-E factor negative regulatory protein RseA